MSERVSIRTGLRNPERYTDAALDTVDLADARSKWAAARVEFGLKPTTPELLRPGHENSKLAKNPAATYGLSLAPHSSGTRTVGTVCPWAGDCKDPCLASAGRGKFAAVQLGRQVRTYYAARWPMEFRAMLRHEIRNAAKRHGSDPVYLRLNVLSDIHYHEEPWTAVGNLPDTCRPYGYSKDPRLTTMAKAAEVGHVLTYSVNERDRTPESIADLLNEGHRAAVVLAHGEPWPVHPSVELVDGDAHDLRGEDPAGSIAVLRAKGKAKALQPAADGSSFVKAATWFSS